MESVKFVMGTGPGQKPAGDKINDTILKSCEVNMIVVNSVPNNDTFQHDPQLGDINSGNEVGFPTNSTVTIFYSPYSSCKCTLSC